MLAFFDTHVVMLGDKHLARFNLGNFCIAYPLDIVVAHTRFQNALGVAHAAQPEVADIWFGGHESHRYFVAYLAAAQIGIHDEGIFVSRSEAGRSLYRPYDDRAGIFREIFPFVMRLHGVIHSANRKSIPAVRPK